MTVHLLNPAPADAVAGAATEPWAELRKLRTINRVLMDRVERDADAHGGNAYTLFRTAVTLEAKVGERTAELARLTHQMRQEIAQRRRAETELRVAKAAAEAAKAEAEAANAAKTRFLAAAGHDLRQPFNAARLFLGALAEEISGERARDLLGRVDAALDTVEDLLGALQDISRLDSGAWPACPSAVPLGPLLARLRAEYAPHASALGIDFRVVACSAVIHTDRVLFERVLRNLIGNAIRYTISGRVLVGCRREPGHARVEVHDTGIGIPADRHAAIFEEFHRLGNAPRDDGKGLGLGLAIVDRIARLLGLRVGCASVVGRGSCFSVAVRLAATTAAAAASDAAGASEGLAGRRVLLIARDPAVVAEIRDLFDGWGSQVTWAETAAGASAPPPDPPPDLLIVDAADCGACAWDGPGDTGGQARPPVLVISGDRSAAMRARAAARGAAFLPKPVSPARLRAMASYLLRAPASG